MENECEDQTMREQARRLAADAADDKMAKFEALFDQFTSRFDEFAKRHGLPTSEQE